MRCAINTVCMPELTWSEALAACKTAGFSRIELLAVPGWVHVDARTAEAETLLTAAARIGVQYAGLHAGGIDGESDDTLAASVEYLQHGLTLAGKLGCSRLVFTGAGLPADLDERRQAQIRARIANGLTELASRATALGIQICLENHYRCQVETLDDYLAIFAALPAGAPVLATVDTGHFTASGIDPADVVRGLKGRIGNVHMKDHIGTESVGLGYGHTDNAAVVRELKAMGYTGDLTVELEVHDRANALRYVREAYPYVEALIGATECTGVSHD